ncbi:uncharacterized protein LOC107209136 [Parus major]|uniref:uncharacterized protein LOC107209136 n=1 Tax=Parus major TaxID=9157 RepID=UPI0007715F2E|nr:uncharacterized protein LOC107209136 [Parus major]
MTPIQRPRSASTTPLNAGERGAAPTPLPGSGKNIHQRKSLVKKKSEEILGEITTKTTKSCFPSSSAEVPGCKTRFCDVAESRPARTGRNLAAELFSLENKRVSVTARSQCQLRARSSLQPVGAAGCSSQGPSKPATAFPTLPNQAARGAKPQKTGRTGQINDFSSLSGGFSLVQAFPEDAEQQEEVAGIPQELWKLPHADNEVEREGKRQLLPGSGSPCPELRCRQLPAIPAPYPWQELRSGSGSGIFCWLGINDDVKTGEMLSHQCVPWWGQGPSVCRKAENRQKKPNKTLVLGVRAADKRLFVPRADNDK